MSYDYNWPEYCTVIGCTDPSLRPHHHHVFLNEPRVGKTSPYHCTCGNVDLPGTRPKES